MNVKIARIKKGLTQQQLCKMLKISSKRLVEIERGHYEKVTKELMEKISETLDSTVQDLFFADDKVKASKGE